MPSHHKQWEDKAGDILGVVEVGLNTHQLMAGVALTPKAGVVTTPKHFH